ncbi:conserved hypothetical protein [Alteracholeplasma palmae J233]|uniref:Polymerase/histidinol phosphatase N-terminal domain-containing protein n=1 Tax=Alteracholeplasma palmae (strain ATCC 49389 / J233) TaxID=1318466 RepID=U4KLJ1_ALTPJ|nr:hypothetical protein [Alteracholeplasma palmae]CCV64713.1 conserved hypothetical protein [Alteracholeplasma palmae J233]
MEKVVSTGLKIDLHIHSSKSKFKDGSLVDKNTIENLPILVSKLNQFNVNMCAISDHDSFDYNLYLKLKNEEGKGSIKKVFPAVEFTVSFSVNPLKPVHIVCVFNDIYTEKIKNIEAILQFDEKLNRPKYDNDEKNAFTENKFIELLSQLDLDVVCIAHQKQSLSSKSKPEKNDANSVGEERFNEFLFSEYFEAFEFKNRKNQVFNNYIKSTLNDDLLRFITGSDCHEWNAYPKYSTKSKDIEFKHTVLKCLPSFKGLALSLTDDSRISLDDNFFNQGKYCLDYIEISIEGKEMKIPLSKGINVIIGDNSIGKSLLLHKMTDYRGTSITPLNKTLKSGYDNYLSQHKFTINTSIDQNKIFAFDMQGDIRLKFNQGKLKSDVFFKDKYPPDIDTSAIKSLLVTELDKVVDSLNTRFDYNEKYTSFGNLTMLKEREDATSISVIDASNQVHTKEQSRITAIITQISKTKAELNSLKSLLTTTEQTEIVNFVTHLDRLNKKYENLRVDIITSISLINCINNAFNDYKVNKTAIKNTADQNLESFIQQEKLFTEAITELLFSNKALKPIAPHIDTKEIKDEGRDYLNFTFIKRTTVQKFDDTYLVNLLNTPFSKTKKATYDSAKTKTELKEILKDYDESMDAIDFYQMKVIGQIDKDLVQKAIPNKLDETGKYVEYSSGLNAQIYFDVLSSDRYKDGIYLIDQPEDDVSPKSIKGHLLRNFKDMGRNRQVLLVTHNPQFVVNLDVDNVIVFTRDKDKINIESGALEYQDPKTNILNLVATLLDGGVETIRKRWKRYEKDN